MNSNDVKNTLRQYDFPHCAKETLKIIENMYGKVRSLSAAGYKCALEIIAEFIFLESEHETENNGSTFNSLQEIQVLMLLCDRLSACEDEYIRNSIFMMCFGGNCSVKRYRMLHLLVTMCMSSEGTPIMRSFGVWIQQSGYTHARTLGLVEQLVTEHFIQSFPEPTLRSYGASAPHFVAGFLTCVSLFYMKERNGKVKMPPRNLLDTAVFWVSSEPDLCMASFEPPELPDRASVVCVVPPLGGLIVWCSMAPLFLLPERIATSFKILEADQEDVYDAVYIELKNTLKGIKHPEPEGDADSEDMMYNKLMEALKISLDRAKDNPNKALAIQTKFLLTMVQPVRLYNKAMVKRNYDLSGHPQLEEAVGRVLKFLHQAIVNGCISGSIENLIHTFNTFPDNMPLKNFITMYEENYGPIKKYKITK